jgi:serine/threonine protein kinase
MSDDKKMSRLISKSLAPNYQRDELPSEESTAVDEHLRKNDSARKFAELSKLIQDSASHAGDLAESGDESVGPGLPSDSKMRMKESIRKATLEKASLSGAGLLGNEKGSAVRDTIDGSGAAVPGVTRDVPVEGERQLSTRYKLLRRIGEGGLGNVWLARDEKLKRNVALKELKSEALESPVTWQRFHREAEITGLLEHPNIISLYQFGEDRKTGEPFYAMRFVGKRTLADAIVEYHDHVEAGEDGSLGLHRLLSVLLDICKAIAYAHSRGVVHRDLKPENVALDSFGQVIVLDWGLAKLLEEGELAQQLTSNASLRDSSLARLAHTQDGAIVGTPLYMAPEQAAGNLDEVDDKTDVYGLGALLFAILTGVAPHEKSAYGSQRHSLPDVLKIIANGVTPSPREQSKTVPRELEQICSKAMAKKRHLRYQSVASFADAVEQWMAGQTEKRTLYENLRMEGRELRADLQSTVNGLERNVQFMSHLPPIQELTRVRSDEETNAWRERLATIFQGLLEANADYRSIIYSKVVDGEYVELVRVERHGKDGTRVRALPRSRLRTGSADEFLASVLTQKPEDVLASLVPHAANEGDHNSGSGVGLCAGVPIFDDATEDVFGAVVIECDVDRILRRQIGQRSVANEIIVVSEHHGILLHAKSGKLVEAIEKAELQEFPYFLDAAQLLQTHPEFIDESDAEVYGARLWFVPGRRGVSYLLRRTPK